MSNQIKLASIRPEVVIDLKISGAFYGRLHQLLLNHAKIKTPEEFAKIIKELKINQEKDIYEHDLATILTLVLSIEEAAKEQDKIELVDVPLSPDDKG